MFANRCQIGFLKTVLEFDPVIPRGFELNTKYFFELLGIVALTVFTAFQPVDQVLREYSYAR